MPDLISTFTADGYSLQIESADDLLRIDVGEGDAYFIDADDAERIGRTLIAWAEGKRAGQWEEDPDAS